MSETREWFQVRYSESQVPSARRILRMVQNLLDFGQLTVPGHAQARGRVPVYPRVLYRAIRRFFIENPLASTRQAARRFGVSQGYVWKLLNASGQHPYHFQPVQDLVLADYPARVTFCSWLLEHLNEAILWTDEATFTRVGLFNVHNEHWWGPINPHATKRDSFQTRFSVNVWAGILNDQILGPHFIEGRLGGQEYLEIVQRVIPEFLEDVPLAYHRNLFFHHDGAPAHFYNVDRSFLNQEFGERWIGRGGPVPWPPRSPDLTPLDFYLWGEVKRRVYETDSLTREELKSKIVSAFSEVKNNTAILHAIKDNHRRRARLCISERGGHFEQLLKYS